MENILQHEVGFSSSLAAEQHNVFRTVRRGDTIPRMAAAYPQLLVGLSRHVLMHQRITANGNSSTVKTIADKITGSMMLRTSHSQSLEYIS
jgi:hypothetical protein